jgi:hypothetical protein
MLTAAPALAAASEVSAGMFLAYVAALVISGILLLIVSVLPIGIPKGNRIIDAVIGAAMLGYAVYLLFFLGDGEFRMFYYAFVAPIFAIVQTVKGVKARKAGRVAA